MCLSVTNISTNAESLLLGMEDVMLILPTGCYIDVQSKMHRCVDVHYFLDNAVRVM